MVDEPCLIAERVPVPLRLGLEVVWLWRLVVGHGWDDGFGWSVVAIVVDRDVTIESTQDETRGEESEPYEYGSGCV